MPLPIAVGGETESRFLIYPCAHAAPRTWSNPKFAAKDWECIGQSMTEAAERIRRGRGMEDGDRVNHDRRWHAAVLSGDDNAWRMGYDAAYEAVRSYVHWRCA